MGAAAMADESHPQTHSRRSQRVMLRLDVLVRFEMDQGQYQTHALAITANAHGGLLESPFKMAVGQGIVFINPRNGMEVGGTVVTVERSSDAYFRTGFEFAQPSPRFWEVAFPPSDWGMAKEPV